MSYFIRNGNTFRVADKASVDIREHLPVGNYIIKEDMFKNLYLEMVDEFEHKGKVYCDNHLAAAQDEEADNDNNNSERDE